MQHGILVFHDKTFEALCKLILFNFYCRQKVEKKYHIYLLIDGMSSLKLWKSNTRNSNKSFSFVLHTQNVINNVVNR